MIDEPILCVLHSLLPHLNLRRLLPEEDFFRQTNPCPLIDSNLWLGLGCKPGRAFGANHRLLACPKESYEIWFRPLHV